MKEKHSLTLNHEKIKYFQKKNIFLKSNVKEYLQILNHIQEGIISLDSEGYITFANSRIEDITGLSYCFMKGKKISDLGLTIRDKNGLSVTKEILTQILEQDPLKIIDNLDILIYNSMKRIYISVLLNVSSFQCSRKKRDIKIILSFLIISSLAKIPAISSSKNAKEFESELKEREELFKLTFEKSPVGKAIVSLHNKILHVNNAFYQMMGYSFSDVIQMDFTQIMHPEDVNKDHQEINKMIQGNIDKYQIEKRFVKKNGELLWIILTVTKAKYVPGISVYFLYTLQDISDKKKIEGNLYENEALYKTVINVLGEGIVIHSEDGKIIACNPASQKILELSEDQLKGKTSIDPSWQTIHEDGSIFPGNTHPAMITLQTGKSLENIVMGVKKISGGISWISINSTPLLFPNKDKIRNAVVSFRDITDLKNSLKLLSESEKEFKAIADYTADFEIWILPDGKIKWVNPGVEKVTGYTQNEFLRISEYPKVFLLPEDYNRIVSFINKGFRKKNYVNDFVFRIIRKDKIIIWVSLSFQSIYSNNLEYLGMRCSIRDITERIILESKLKDNQHFIQSILDASPNIIYIYDLSELRNLYSNKSMERLLGYSSQEIISMGSDIMINLLHHDDIIPVYKYFAQHKDSKENNIYEITYRMKNKNGNYVWLKSSEVIFKKDPDNNITQILGIAEDITLKVSAFEMLKESEQKLLEAERIAKLGHWSYNLLTNEMFWSLQMYYIYDISMDLKPTYEIFQSVVHPEDRKYANDIMNNAIKSKLEEYEFDYRIIIKNGEIRFIHALARILFNSDREAINTFGIAQDITQRKMIERSLQNINERFNLAVNSASIGIWDWDINKNLLIWDDRMYDLYGIQKNDFLLTYENWLNCLHPEDVEREKNIIEVALKGNSEYNSEFRIIRNNGEVRYLNTNAKIVSNSDGKPLRMVGINYDITSRRLAEESLKQSESRFRTLTKLAPVGILLADISGKCQYINERFQEITGLTFSQISNDGWQSRIHHDDKNKIISVWNNLISANKEWELEYRFLGLDGKIIWVFSLAKPFNDEYENKYGFINIIIDITAQIEMRDKLVESQKQLRSLSSHLEMIREDERTKISREIHDELGQSLTGLKMDLIWLKNELSVKNYLDDIIINKIKIMSSSVDSTVVSIREIITELRPGILDLLGLPAAIEWKLNECHERVGIEYSISIDPPEISLSKQIAISLFRIFQEALTNIIKHSKSTMIKVVFEKTDVLLNLIIQDNGIGIPNNIISSTKTFGILGMKERVNNLNGKFEIFGFSGKGTVISISIPVDESHFKL